MKREDTQTLETAPTTQSSRRSHHPGPWRRRLIILAAFLGLAGLGVYDEVGEGAVFLVRAAADRPLDSEEVQEQERTLVHEGRDIPIKIYRPQGGFERTILLAHGVHFEGIRDERLVGFCRRLSSAGFAVVTPDLEDIKSYELKGRAVEDLEATGRWILEESSLLERAPDRRFAMMGISFGGGMAISAAARPALRDHVSSVFSFGGHGDLERTITYLVTGEGDSEASRPHVYGQAILMRRLASRLVQEDKVGDFRQALDAYLQGREEEALVVATRCGKDAETLMQLCLQRRAETLAKTLRPMVDDLQFDDILSPIRGPSPSCPIFLLHGAEDNVVPASEARAVARWASAATRVESLISNQVIHVEFSEELPTPAEAWHLARFLTEFLES